MTALARTARPARRLGRSDVAVTVLGLGCAPLGNLYAAVADDVAAATVDAAWRAGVRWFDTAPHYGLGLSERRLGAALRARARGEAVVSTKVGRVLEPVADRATSERDDAGFDVPRTAVRRWDWSAAGVRHSLEASLERLALERVDVVHLHDPDDHLPQAVSEAYPALARLRDDGVVGAVGAGMNTTEGLRVLVEACDLDVVLVAGRYTLLDQRGLDGLLQACVRRGTSVVAGGVFNSGILASERPTPDAPFDYAPAPPHVRARVAALAEVCAAHGVTLPQAALHLPLLHPAVAAVVVGARSPEEVATNAALLDAPVPVDLWRDLKARRLLREDAPTEGTAP